MRKTPVIQFVTRPPPGPVADALDLLEALFGKEVSLCDVALLMEAAGFVTAAAAGSPGTSVPVTRVPVDFADAGVDQVRLVVYGKNSGAGAVTLAVYDVTNARTLATVVVTGNAANTFIGEWTTIQPTGADQVLELRVVGAGETPTLYALHAQFRTLQARK